MSYWLSLVLSFSIVFPAIAGLLTFGRIYPVHYPFIFCIWLGLANESVSVWSIQQFHTNAVNANIYVLLEAGLFCWQFQRWGLFARYKWIFPALIGLLIVGWCLENCWLSSIRIFSSWFRIGYSFLLVLLAISFINYQIVRGKKATRHNPAIVISLVFIVFYTYKVFVEIFWLYGINENATFRTNVYFILNVINLISNLIFTLAILWMPTRHRFLLPS